MKLQRLPKRERLGITHIDRISHRASLLVVSLINPLGCYSCYRISRDDTRCQARRSAVERAIILIQRLIEPFIILIISRNAPVYRKRPSFFAELPHEQ